MSLQIRFQKRSNKDVADIITQKKEWIDPLVRLHSDAGNNNGMKDAVKQVVAQAYAGDSQDNITAMIVDLGSLEQSK